MARPAQFRFKPFQARRDLRHILGAGDDQTLDASRPLGSEPDTPPRIYIYNVLAELDVEGEYFVDRNSANWTVWWRPPGGNVSSSNAAYVSLLQNVVSMENVTDVALVGLSLRHARGDGVAIVGCANVSIRRSEIIGHGNLGVNMTNCSDSSVVDSVIAETGDGGVWLQGGDRASLTKSNLTLVGCNLSTFNRWDRTYRPGVSLLGCGARVERCTFTRSPHQCVMIVGNEHCVLDSTFTASLFESSDSGAVYSEQDWTSVVTHRWLNVQGSPLALLSAYAMGISLTSPRGRVVGGLGQGGAP